MCSGGGGNPVVAAAAVAVVVLAAVVVAVVVAAAIVAVVVVVPERDTVLWCDFVRIVTEYGREIFICATEQPKLFGVEDPNGNVAEERRTMECD